MDQCCHRGSCPPRKGLQPSDREPRSFVNPSSEANISLPRPSLPTPPRPGVTKGPFIPPNLESASSRCNSFRVKLPFTMRLHLQKTIISNLEMNAVPSSETLNPESLYLFEKRDKIRDHEMEGCLSGIADPPLVSVHQTVSLSTGFCRNTSIDGLLTANISQPGESLREDMPRAGSSVLGEGPSTGNRLRLADLSVGFTNTAEAHSGVTIVDTIPVGLAQFAPVDPLSQSFRVNLLSLPEIRHRLWSCHIKISRVQRSPNPMKIPLFWSLGARSFPLLKRQTLPLPKIWRSHPSRN